jgi:serine/threonine protein kinase
VITLTLLHPVQFTPVQFWTFEDDEVVRIGRSIDNQVILYSAVVSRHHVELRRHDLTWEIINLGANGTYLEGKRITQMPVKDGLIIRLARSGPNLQIHLGLSAHAKSQAAAHQIRVTQRVQPDLIDEQDLGIQPEPTTQPTTSPPLDDIAAAAVTKHESGQPTHSQSPLRCRHPRATEEDWFCQDCGAPLRSLKSVGEYHLLQKLDQTDQTLTYLGWKAGQTVMIKTLQSEWLSQPAAIAQFTQEAELLQTLNHPNIPRWLDCLTIAAAPYLVMEMVYGQTLLQRVLQQGSLPQTEAIAWMVELCHVLEYLHAQPVPILNRIIQPGTLAYRAVCTATCKLALLDFGEIKLGQVNRPAAAYLAPEQQQEIFTPATPLFSVGITLAFLISGQDPSGFYGQREQGYRFYAEYVPGLSPELVPIIRKLTHPDPADRYQSAAQVAEILQAIA